RESDLPMRVLPPRLPEMVAGWLDDLRGKTMRRQMLSGPPRTREGARRGSAHISERSGRPAEVRRQAGRAGLSRARAWRRLGSSRATPRTPRLRPSASPALSRVNADPTRTDPDATP